MTPTTTKIESPAATQCRRQSATVLALLRPALLAGVLLAAAGCAPVGTMWYTLFGNPPNPPLYTPAKTPTLVLVEADRGGNADEFDADLVAAQLADQLKAHKVCPLVDASRILQLRDTNPTQYRSMSIAELGRSVGAKQVVYVSLQNSNGDPDLGHPGAQVEASARVRVVDVATGAASWPVDNQIGYPLSADVPFDAQGTESTDAHTAVLTKLSDSIARLFYPYSADSSDDDPIDKPHVLQDM